MCCDGSSTLDTAKLRIAWLILRSCYFPMWLFSIICIQYLRYSCAVFVMFLLHLGIDTVWISFHLYNCNRTKYMFCFLYLTACKYLVFTLALLFIDNSASLIWINLSIDLLILIIHPTTGNGMHLSNSLP